MFSREDLARSLDELLGLQGGLGERYRSLLPQVDDAPLRARLAALRQEAERQAEALDRLRTLAGARRNGP